MAIGTVFVAAFDKKGVAHAAAAALPFVKSSGAELVGVHVRERYPSGYVAEYYWHAAVVKEFEAGITQRAADTRAAMEGVVGSDNFSWLQPEGSEDVDYGPAMRTADLIIAPPPDACERSDAAALIETIMIGSGRPVLITPVGSKPKVPETILIGWNGSVEASRAIAVARPLLDQAKSVHVISVGQAAARTPTAEEVAAALTAGGIKAEGRTIAKSDGVSKTLREEASRVGADALLLGAFSHSRIRERILGGVTRRVLTEPSMTTILVH